VDKVITDLAVFDFVDGKLVLKELAEGVTLEEIAQKTEASYEIDLAE
jgi:3-oxoacid CoA-transferase subunit B